MESILESFSKIANEEIWHSFLAWLLDQALRWCLGGRSTVARKFALLLSTVANEELVRARRVPQCGGYQEPDVAGHLGPRGLQDGEVGIAPSDWPANAEVALRAWSRSGQGNLYGSGAILIGSLTWPGCTISKRRRWFTDIWIRRSNSQFPCSSWEPGEACVLWLLPSQPWPRAHILVLFLFPKVTKSFHIDNYVASHRTRFSMSNIITFEQLNNPTFPINRAGKARGLSQFL